MEQVMAERRSRYRIHSHLTRSRFLHVEDALDIGKVRLFAGEYERGQGARVTASHYLDVADALVLLNDLATASTTASTRGGARGGAWGKDVDYVEYKGTGGDRPTSRVLKVKRNGDKVWFRLESGPGEVIGEGAVKPAGKPETVVNVPFTIWEARRLAFVVLAHLQAWEVVTFRQRACPATASTRGGELAERVQGG
ncbi:MAG: hypothetical protein SXV54_23095 [Chloroflexota bacterium]|nr:hypothetical protein [Chloroflexota bacterium]